MTDDIHPPDDGEQNSNDAQHAVEACKHALDALDNGDLAHAQSLLDEAQAAVERAQHDRPAQVSRETASDCYE